MRKTVRTIFDHQDFRRDRRHPLPPILFRIAGRDYRSVNWSLGGFQLVATDLGLEIGDALAGTLRVSEPNDQFGFKAEIAWIDRKEGTLGAKFIDLAPRAIEALDRILFRRLSRARP